MRELELAMRTTITADHDKRSFVKIIRHRNCEKKNRASNDAQFGMFNLMQIN